jgi:glycosyltransferase involved in cell wall biosynthesis
MLLSIIIPTHNRSERLAKALSALMADLNHAADAEVIVVDDGSFPAFKKENCELCAKNGVRYLAHEQRRGAAAARNTGVKNSMGSWIAFLDDDVTVCRNWSGRLREKLESLPDDVVGVEGRVDAEGCGLWDREVVNESGGLFLTCHCLYRGDILKKENSFDEHFTGRYPACEDHELAARMLRWGSVAFDPNIRVSHAARSVRLFAYLMGSFERIRSQLDAEFYFFSKQRDRYHLFRYHSTFFGTLRAIMLRHMFTTMHRRPVIAVMRHPLQSLVLVLSCLLEQAYAWLLAPEYIYRFLVRRTAFFFNTVDLQKTLMLWNGSESFSVEALRLKTFFVKSLLFPVLRLPVHSPLPFLRHNARLIPQHEKGRCFLRIDDVFLDQQEAVVRLCEITSKKKIPFLAAITGKDLADQRYGELADLVRSSGGEIGLHGFLHAGKFGPYNSEILQMSFPQLEAMVEAIFTDVPGNRRPLAFIPPFNAISRDQILYLGKYFPVICGGPETARLTDNMFGPVALKNGSWYFPAFYPFYQDAAAIIRSRAMAAHRSMDANICFAVHMPDEAMNGFESFSELVDRICEELISWTYFSRNSSA